MSADSFRGDRRSQPRRAGETLQARVIGPAVAVESDFRTAGGEHAPFVLVGLLRRHALELVRVEWNALPLCRVDADRPFRIVEPGVADRQQKRIRAFAPAATPGNDEIR